MLSKNVNNKKCAPKFMFFKEKKNAKDSPQKWAKWTELAVVFSWQL